MKLSTQGLIFIQIIQNAYPSVKSFLFEYHDGDVIVSTSPCINWLPNVNL